jgi:hypothetical protein
LAGVNTDKLIKFVTYGRKKFYNLGPRPDYYSALGISKAADVKQIKLAYFRMAKKYHPVRFSPIFF